VFPKNSLNALDAVGDPSEVAQDEANDEEWDEVPTERKEHCTGIDAVRH
jgi:hypothetical protein